MFLDVAGITKRFGRCMAIEDISFSAAKGEMVSIIGPSGAGKTTLLKIIAGLEQADSGTVRADADLEKNPAILVFQDYILFPTMTVYDNVAFGLKCRKTSGSETEKKVMAILDYFQLTGKREFFPAHLSAGQQQRVALARAMVVEPSLLLLDEPFANLDRNLKAETAEFIRLFQKNYSITTICVTHDLLEAFMMSDKIGIMLEGILCQYGDAKSVYHNPLNEKVASFTGHVNTIPQSCYSLIGMPADVSLPQGEMRVRAESIVLENDPEGPAVIEDVLFAGHYVICRLSLGGSRLTVYSLDSRLSPQQRVRVRISSIL